MQLSNQTCLTKEVHLQPIGTKVGMIRTSNSQNLGLQGRKIMRHISPPKTQDVHKLLRIIGLAKTTGTIDQIPTTMDKDLATIAPTIDHIPLTIETIDLLLLIGTIDNIPRVGITKGTIRLQPITIGLLLRDGIIKIHPKGRIRHI